MPGNSAADNPLLRFQEDRRPEAEDPMAVCVLATVDKNGIPQARTLILRDIAEGMAVYINASSPKWQQCQDIRRHSNLVALCPGAVSDARPLQRTTSTAHCR